ncbi:MAG: TetR family transcriptional regulator [Planctomycetes bacterium]|nr:TetR family transcriptional regulator [Planctomycetota bacterium]
MGASNTQGFSLDECPGAGEHSYVRMNQLHAPTSTPTRLLDAAEHLFAMAGYAGASVRAVAASAGADLGSVRYHFGSKAGLFGAVLRRRVEPLNERRLGELADLEQRAGGRPCDLEALLDAFVTPAFELLTHPVHGADWVKLVARVRLDPEPFRAAGPSGFQDVIDRYLAAMQRALPDLDAIELRYRWHFFFGAQVNTLVDAAALRSVVGSESVGADAEALKPRLIRFCAAGFRA